VYGQDESTILAGPRTARITKALVYDEQSAATVNVFQSTNEDVGDFILMITPRPGHALTNLEAAAEAIIDRLKTEGPTAEEIQTATAGEELSFVRGLESNSGRRSTTDGAGYHGDAASASICEDALVTAESSNAGQIPDRGWSSASARRQSDQAAPDQSNRVTNTTEEAGGSEGRVARRSASRSPRRLSRDLIARRYRRLARHPRSVPA
jgi:hypothetical protein